MKIKLFIIISIVTFIFGIFILFFINLKINKNNNILSNYISDEELWNDINSYDAGHLLLIPMFFAFSENDVNQISIYDDLFKRFSNYLKNQNYEYKFWDLNHIQFLFLASNYINLCSEYNHNIENIPKELLNYLYDESFYYLQLEREKYKTSEIPQYNTIIGIKQNLDAGVVTTDQYMYHLAIISNLYEFSKLNKIELSDKRKRKMQDIQEIVNRIFTERVTFTQGNKWLFDVGCYDNHEDYAYMNYMEINENMIPSKNENTTWDTSHFMRIPVFLQIFKRLNKDNDEMYNYYKKLILGLKEQFLENVLVYPDSENTYFRTTNYMDGRNGLYRYNYNTAQNNAYLPYQISGSLTLGWWCFLGNGINDVYSQMYKTFPLSEEGIKTYVGPNTTRERNKYAKWPDFFENGFAKTICLYASKLDVDSLFE